MAKRRYRVLEITNANDETLFYPEYTNDSFFFFPQWKRFIENQNFGYDSYAVANHWLCKQVLTENKEVIINAIPHKCDPIFDKLQQTKSNQGTDSETHSVRSGL